MMKDEQILDFIQSNHLNVGWIVIGKKQEVQCKIGPSEFSELSDPTLKAHEKIGGSLAKSLRTAVEMIRDMTTGALEIRAEELRKELKKVEKQMEVEMGGGIRRERRE